MQNTQHYYLNWQIFPWLEGSFRYSGLQHFDPLYPVYYDRSFAMKARLWDETDTWPAFVVGANDAIGTGAYSGEYFVASKQFGDVDATLGMGFGRLGSTALFRNPFTLLSQSFENRNEFPNIVPGSTAFNTLFHGPSGGLFGSVVWRSPIDGLSLITEYSSDRYVLESGRGNFRPRSQLNFGLNYQLTEDISTTISWMYGRSLGANLTLELDPTTPQYPQKITPPLPEVTARQMDDQERGLAALLQLPQRTPS